MGFDCVDAVKALIFSVINKNAAHVWTAFLMSDSRGARTHDPILKRDVLYLLS